MDEIYSKRQTTLSAADLKEEENQLQSSMIHMAQGMKQFANNFKTQFKND